MTAAEAAEPAVVQATARSFHPDTRTGTVLLDDGTEVAYDAAAFDAGGLRMLRIGQRVRMAVAADGRITALTLVTLPLPD
jgi:2-phospho-L-lactate/phosphoenolpyruvate guanylyltransferase